MVFELRAPLTAMCGDHAEEDAVAAVDAMVTRIRGLPTPARLITGITCVQVPKLSMVMRISASLRRLQG
jgi:hypothetical protein